MIIIDFRVGALNHTTLCIPVWVYQMNVIYYLSLIYQIHIFCLAIRLYIHHCYSLCSTLPNDYLYLYLTLHTDYLYLYLTLHTNYLYLYLSKCYVNFKPFGSTCRMSTQVILFSFARDLYTIYLVECLYWILGLSTLF